MANTIIKINEKYQLVFDPYCMWIEEKKIHKNDKKIGKTVIQSGTEYTTRVSGYHRYLSDLVESLEVREFMKLEGFDSLKELAEAHKAIHEEIRQLCGDMVELKIWHKK